MPVNVIGLLQALIFMHLGLAYKVRPEKHCPHIKPPLAKVPVITLARPSFTFLPFGPICCLSLTNTG
jgi:hypothetical protein